MALQGLMFADSYARIEFVSWMKHTKMLRITVGLYANAAAAQTGEAAYKREIMLGGGPKAPAIASLTPVETEPTNPAPGLLFVPAGEFAATNGWASGATLVRWSPTFNRWEALDPWAFDAVCVESELRFYAWNEAERAFVEVERTMDARLWDDYLDGATNMTEAAYLCLLALPSFRGCIGV